MTCFASAGLAPIAQRVDALLAQMTLPEKIAQLAIIHVANESYIWNNASLIQTGVGSQKVSLLPASSAKELAELRNEYQVRFMNNSRLHIPMSFHTEALEGAGPDSTRMPMANAIGASWDPELARRVGAVLGSEMRAMCTDTGYYVVQPVTKAMFGRIEETPSEDPRLAGAMSAAMSAGMQAGTVARGGEPSPSTDSYAPPTGAIFVAKHFAGYGAEAWNSQPVHVTPYYLRDSYLPAWRSAFWLGNARGVMFMHASWNGEYAHASQELGQEILRAELNSTALAVTDCSCARNAFRIGMVTDETESAILSVRDSTIDQELQCGGPADWVYPFLLSAVQQGRVSEDVIDTSVRRVLAAKFAMGLFEQPFVDPAKAEAQLRTPASLNTALEASQQSIVLARNVNGTLPYNVSGRTIALVGPLAGCGATGKCDPHRLAPEQQAVLGRTYNQLGSVVDVPMVFDWLKSKGADVRFARGAEIESTAVNPTELKNAVDAANAADAVVMVVGDSVLSCIESGANPGDRDSLDLAGTQMPLLAAMANATRARGIPLIVVLINGRPTTFGEADGNALLNDIDALLVAGRPGEAGPHAIADIINGDNEPSGRFAQAWPRRTSHLLGPTSGPWYLPRIAAFGNDSSHRYGQQFWFESSPDDPLFPFGSGLSTSALQPVVGAPAVTAFPPAQHRPAGVGEQAVDIPVGSTGVRVFPSAVLANVSVPVSNPGSRAAAVVVQLYCRDPDGLGLVRYYERLVGFAKVWLQPGQSTTVTVPVTADSLAMVGRRQDGYPITVPAGTYGIWAGPSSDPHTWSTPSAHPGAPLVIE